MLMGAPTWALWLALAGSFLAGFCLRWWANARQFERRNEQGIEQFRSYNDLMSTRFIETVVSMLANVFLAVGLCFVLLIASRELLGV